MTRTPRAFVRAVTDRTDPSGGGPARADGDFNREMTDSEMDQITGGYEGPGDYNVNEDAWWNHADRETATRILRGMRGGGGRVNS